MPTDQEDKTGQERKALIDEFFELVELARSFIRQELQTTMDKYVVSPAKKVGFWLFLTIVSATFLALAAIFLVVGAFQLLAVIVGATWIAYLIIGAFLLVAAVIILVVRPGLGGSNGKK